MYSVDFVIMDGLQGFKNGPCAYYFLGHNKLSIADDQKNMRLILAGKDPVAVDAIESLRIGSGPTLVLHLVSLHNDDKFLLRNNSCFKKKKFIFVV